MIPIQDVVALNLDAAYSAVLNTVKQTEFSRYPVYKDETINIVGFIHVRDLLYITSEKRFSLRKILRKPHFIPYLRPVRKQFLAFKTRQSHLSFVVDEYGNVVGLVSLEDILEEIVGEIRDEYDTSPTGLQKLADGSYLIEGRVLIRDLNRWLDLSLPEREEVRTIGGLILSEMGRIPQLGDEVITGRYRLTIRELKGKRIKRVHLQILSALNGGATSFLD
jgi:CBS domain containing-hemolysin-like protein